MTKSSLTHALLLIGEDALWESEGVVQSVVVLMLLEKQQTNKTKQTKKEKEKQHPA